MFRRYPTLLRFNHVGTCSNDHCRSCLIRACNLQGVLTYYEDQSDEPPYGKVEKGRLVLTEMTLVWEQKRLHLSSKTDDLLIDADSVQVAAAWAGPLQNHIAYANKKALPKAKSRRTSVFG